MSSIWLNPDYAKILTYGATVKGPKAIVKVEIEVNEPGALGFLLQDLADAQKDLQRKRPESAPRSEGPRGIEQKKLLALPYFGEGK